MLTIRMILVLAAVFLIQLVLGTLFVTAASASRRSDDFSVTMRMPNVVSYMPDTLACTGTKLGPEEAYIVKFIPHANKTTAHHMMVYGCHTPANHKPSWMCDKEEGQTYSDHAVCADEERMILFAWAMDAPEKSLPEGVGLRVSGNTRINYLILQLHYAHAFQPGVTDSSGITLEITYSRPQQQVGYLVLGNWGLIPAQKSQYHMDSSCEFKLNYTIYPIGYRTHSHNLGVVTSGYRIREGEWLEIGRMSPQLPQTFYEVSNPGMDIRKNDMLAGRCTMNSMARGTDTKIGPTNNDEMCNFYIMYSTYEQGNLRTTYCFKDSNNYSWQKEFTMKEIPQNSASLDGIPGAEEIMDKFSLPMKNNM